MADSAPLQNPGVRIPPPLVYVAGLLVSWLVDRQWPWPIAGGGPTGRLALAGLCAALFLAFAGPALGSFVRAHTSLLPFRPASALVTSGPYRVTRNPMYVGLAALYLAVALVLGTWWAVVALPLVLLVIDRAVIAREERYLAAAFPAAYATYRRQVRRWL